MYIYVCYIIYIYNLLYNLLFYFWSFYIIDGIIHFQNNMTTVSDVDRLVSYTSQFIRKSICSGCMLDVRHHRLNRITFPSLTVRKWRKGPPVTLRALHILLSIQQHTRECIFNILLVYWYTPTDDPFSLLKTILIPKTWKEINKWQPQVWPNLKFLVGDLTRLASFKCVTCLTVYGSKSLLYVRQRCPKRHRL